jgi:hypothetical protein
MPKRPTTRPTREAHPPFAPQPLEPRALLAAIAWDGGGLDGDWHNPLNWEGDVLPGPANRAIIGSGAVVSIDAGAHGAVESIDLDGTLNIGDALDVTGRVTVRDSGSFGVLAAGQAAATDFHAAPGQSPIAIAGTMAISGRGTLARAAVVSGELRIAHRVVWTGGSIDLPDQAARIVVAQGAALRGRFAAGVELEFEGDGVLEVDGTFDVSWAAQQGNERQRLIFQARLDADGTVRVRNGELEFYNDIAQVQPTSEPGEQVLAGGVWEARRRGVLSAVDAGILRNEATVLIGPNGRNGMLGLSHPLRPPFNYTELHNAGTITLIGSGRLPGKTVNEGVIRKTGGGVRVVEGAFLNKPGGRLEVVEGEFLFLFGPLEEPQLRNEGVLILGDLHPGGPPPRITIVGLFEQSQTGTTTFLAAHDGQRFRMGSIVLEESNMDVAGSLAIRVVGTPAASTQTYRWNIISIGWPGSVFSPATTFDIEGRAGSLRIHPGRVVVVARP